MKFFTKWLAKKEMYLTKREIALTVAWKYLGKWYLWGGDNPQGFDCSGFVIEVLKSAGKLPAKGDWTASGLWYRFSKKCLVHTPQVGCLVFFRQLTDPAQKIVHVEMCIDEELSIGAMGGGTRIREDISYSEDGTDTDRSLKRIEDKLDRLLHADAFAYDAYIKIRKFKEKGNLVVHGYVDPFLDEDK